VENFIKELHALLEKHKATLYVELDGDTYCLGTTFMAEINGKTISLNECSSFLDASDLTSQLQGIDPVK
jgi:hypothetical protein